MTDNELLEKIKAREELERRGFQRENATRAPGQEGLESADTNARHATGRAITGEAR